MQENIDSSKKQEIDFESEEKNSLRTQKQFKKLKRNSGDEIFNL